MTASPRIFVAGIATESHGFNRNPTTLKSFVEDTLYYVPEHTPLADIREGDYYFGGYADVADQEGWELVIGLYSFAWPAGPVEETAFETLWARIETQIVEEGPFDAFLLPLHGGMACEHLDDPEGEFIARIRRLAGDEVPVAVSLDLHANLSPEFVRACDIICAFHTAPHVDIRKTATRTASLLARTLRGEIQPQCHSIHPPVLFGIDGGRTTVPEAPMFELLDMTRQFQSQDPQLLDASFLASYPYADQTWTGASAVVVMDGDSPYTDRHLDAFGQFIWDTRDVSTISIVSMHDAIKAAQDSEGDAGPFLLADFTDCPYAGGYGDGTAMLKALVEAKVQNAVLGPLFDKEAVEAAHEAGVGAEIELSLGGKCDPSFGGGPFKSLCRVLALSDGRFVHRGPYLQDQEGDLGKSCCLDVQGVQVIVNPFPSQLHDREQFKLFGIRVEDMNVVVPKAYNHVRADLEPFSRGLLYPDSGGLFSPAFDQFDFRRIRRPIHPLDDLQCSIADMTRT